MRVGYWLLGLALGVGIVTAAPARAADNPTPAAAECMSEAPAGLEQHWTALCSSPREDLVLHRMRAGQAAFAAGHDHQAEVQFDAVLDAIESVYAENEAAAKARSVWHAEKAKDFKGEPFERVMAYYYRGLLYLMADDWGNAQASFKGAVLQDSFALLERHRSDVASMVWLEGWARRCQGAGAAADELFAEAATLRPALLPPARDANLLVVAETGTGPRKSTTGQYNEKLVIREGRLGNDRLVALLDGKRADLVEAEDLFFQATTRGGRQMDKILAEKASTKETTSNLGAAAMIAGTAAASAANTQRNDRDNNGGSGSRAAGAIGGAAMLIGLLAYASAQAMNPEADTRTWDTLPHSVYVAAMPYSPEPTGVAGFDLEDSAGHSVIGDRTGVRTSSQRACSLVWVGSGTLLPSSVGPTPTQPETQPSGPPTCRTPSGAEKALSLDICRRIGGTPLE